MNGTPVLEARGLVKLFGRVVGLDAVDMTLYSGEILAVIGDNGAGKSTLIKCLSGALIPDRGQHPAGREGGAVPEPRRTRGTPASRPSTSSSPSPRRSTSPKTCSSAREIRRKGLLGKVLRMIDTGEMKRESTEQIKSLGISTLQNIGQAVETLSGGQRQAVAVARAAAFGSKVVILDEPTAALGVRETGQVIKLIRELRDGGKAVILISHDMPHVFELADRIHIQRLGARAAVITPKSHTMEDAVAIMTGARQGQVEADAHYPERAVASPKPNK